LHDFYKTLLSLKKNNPALRAGDTAVTTHLFATSQNKNVLVFLRKNGNREVVVFINFSGTKTFFDVYQDKDSYIKGTYTDVFYKKAVDLTNQNHFELEPWSYMVFEK